MDFAKIKKKKKEVGNFFFFSGGWGLGGCRGKPPKFLNFKLERKLRPFGKKKKKKKK